MKKLLLLAAVMAVATVSSYGQGSVSFANTTATRTWYEPTAGGATTLIPAGTMFNAELMYAPDGTAAGEFNSLAIRVGAATSFGGPLALPGIFNGGGRTVTSISPAGSFGQFQVRVWDTAHGNDYTSARAAGGTVGTSAILRVDTADPTTVPPGTPASLVTAGLATFTATVVPEPSAIALGILGVGALLMLRRRK